MTNISSNIIFALIAGGISFLFSLIGTPLIVKACRMFNLYDQPNARKVHAHAIPRLGGILFMPSMAFGILASLAIMFGNLHESVTFDLSSIAMLFGAITIYLIGMLDDIQGMKATHKFVVQIIAALLFPLCNLMINNLHGFLGVYELPLLVSYPITVFVILLIVNAMNLIDGIDGLSSSLAFFILCIQAYLYFDLGTPLFVMLSLSLAGAVLAFFIYNFFGKIDRCKIFMGDAGSLYLGYVIAYLAIKYQMSNGNFTYREDALLTSYTLVLIPCFDVIRVAISRKLNHKEMFEPDKTHIHHRIMQMGLSMHQTLGVILTLFFAFGLINYGLCVAGCPFTIIVLADVIIYSTFIWFTGFVARIGK